MNVWLIIILTMFAILISFMIMLYNKNKQLQMFRKKHQQDISTLSDENNKISIKQKLMFYIVLSFIKQTQEYAKERIRQRYEISEKILNSKKLLIEYFQELTQEDKFSIKVRNGKYIFNFKHRKY